jgi:hypothetical protein
VANQFFVDILESNNDPRLEYYFYEIEAGGFVGSDITDPEISPNSSTINTDSYFASSRNYPLVTESELYFLIAEAKERLGQDASDDLNAAIEASVDYVTDGAEDGSSIAVYTDVTATQENILTEKWKALFGQIEPYNDYRRTGIPALVPRPEAAGAARSYIPKRFPLVQEERLYNPNITPVGLDVPVWWAQP